MSFLDEILESSDVDEKAVSDMQQSLQRDLFTSQGDKTSSSIQSYIPSSIPPKSDQKTAAILYYMSTQESVKKLKSFLHHLINISNKQDASTGQKVKDLIGEVMAANIDEEAFLNELQVALKSPPQPHLLVFLKQSVPVLRNEMQVWNQSMSLQNQPIGPIQPAVQPQPQPRSPESEQKTAAILSNMSTQESVKKLKSFLNNLLNISSRQDASTGQTVKDLIGKVMIADIDEETFLNGLQVALKSPPQPHLLVFLKQSIPVLKNEMESRRRNIQSRHSKQPPHQFGADVGGGSHYHPAPTFSVPQQTFADNGDDTEMDDVTSRAEFPVFLMVAGPEVGEEKRWKRIN